MTETKHPVQSVQRAFTILHAFEGGRLCLGVSAIARLSGLHKSTVSRLLFTLEQLGAVRRYPDSDEYSIGAEVVRLASEVSFTEYLRAVAYPHLANLAAQSGETVKLCILKDGLVLHLDEVAGKYLVSGREWTGLTCPPHTASSGKVLLAFLPPAEIEQYLARPLERATEHTVVDADKLRRELAAVRAAGCAWGMEELEIGLIGVSAPIFDGAGQAVASVNISGPAYRFAPEKQPGFAHLVRETARALTHTLRSRILGPADEPENGPRPERPAPLTHRT